VLVGDPRQLSATVLSMVAAQKGYDRSLFERLETSGVPVWQLLVQYR
jgi:senataxin